MAKLPDFITAENELDGQEHVYIAQGGKTRKTLLQKIKEFVIGTATMGTTATDITGAIAEHTSQLNDIAKNINGWIVYNDITELGLVSGTETMEKICIAMQDKSVLMYTVVSNVASSNSAYPCSYGGTLKIEKLNINRIKLEYSCGANDTIYSYVGYFYSNKFTGWKEIASGDTGWIDLVLNSGIIARTGATPQIRRIGKQVFLRGSILAKCLSNTSNTALFAIPAGFIPNKLVEFTSISALSLFVDCYILQSNGTVNARISAVTTNESYYFFLDDCASWLVD